MLMTAEEVIFRDSLPDCDIIYSLMTPADTKACAELEKILFPEDNPWSLAVFNQSLREKNAHYFVAKVDDRVVGYAGIMVNAHICATAEVYTIGVHPHYQGYGIGRRLLAIMLEIADKYDAEVFLEVRTDNSVAKKLYESVDFTVVGLRPKYYQPSNKDAYTMRRNRQTS